MVSRLTLPTNLSDPELRAYLQELIRDIEITSDTNIQDIQELELIQDAKGWAYYDDSTYTSGSPLNIDNARTAISIDGAGPTSESRFLPGDGELWDTSNNLIIGRNLGDVLTVRLDFKGVANNNNSYFDIEFDIGSGSPNVIVSKTRVARKGSGNEQRYSITVQLYTLDTFITNGCKIYLDTTGSGHDYDFYDFGILVERTYRKNNTTRV